LEPIIQRVVFDQRGFPIFDPYVKLETRISGNLAGMSSRQHMEAATRQLKNDIAVGRVDRNLFTKAQLDKIEDEARKIPGYTWHHHQETGRMQLVPEDLHEWMGHIGGNKLWGTGK
jgi:filamentous hemagglutinin